MKIYNEVVTIFNDNTGLWETIYEDYENYSGPMVLMQGTLPNNATAISAQDTIADTIKTTTGYFTAGDGTLSGTNIYTGSLSDSNELYYFNVNQTDPGANNTEVQFAVTFGHIDGSGSNQYGDSADNPSQIYGETQAIYKQFTNLLLEETEASGGFKISAYAGGGGALGAGVRDNYIYVLVGKRARFKDRINKKSWTLTLSGSTTSAGTAATSLNLTDDSAVVAGISTPAGPRYNIVKGSLGNPTDGYADRTYGWFYPEMGCMVFSGAELAVAIPGATAGKATVAQYSFDGLVDSTSTSRDWSGFEPNVDAHSNAKNALRFVNCLRVVGPGTVLRLRSEEDQSQENFFCRIKASQYNFSANPTFTSGSYNKIRNKDMHGNPSTFITGVGLYNSAGQLLAIAKLSSPLKKNFASEATVKVKLTY